MFGKKNPPINSLIAQGSLVQGDLRFTGGFRIDGEVVGNILADPGQPSMLVIGEGARVTGAIFADHAIINGRVTGPVRAAELLELQPKADVRGDVHYNDMEIQPGALIAGQLRPLATDEKKTRLGGAGWQRSVASPE